MLRVNCPFEVKANTNSGEFEGYASVFGNKDLGHDVILEGAFQKVRTTKDNKLRVALYHDLQRLAGKADFEEDSTGLAVHGQLNMNVSYVPDAYELMKDGTLDGLSVGFNILPGGVDWDTDDEDDYVRIISKAELWEFSIVPFGMNPEALVTDVKGIEDIKSVRELEHTLRHSLGFSKSQAKAIANKGFDGLREAGGSSGQREVDQVTLSDVKKQLKESWNFS